MQTEKYTADLKKMREWLIDKRLCQINPAIERMQAYYKDLFVAWHEENEQYTKDLGKKIDHMKTEYEALQLKYERDMHPESRAQVDIKFKHQQKADKIKWDKMD
jgi:hypothetical protein